MTSQRVLAGVAHDIAHHAVSGVCYVHPHLFKACQAAGVRDATVDLLVGNPYPVGFPDIEPLRLSLTALAERFVEILQANGFGITDLTSAEIKFQFPLLAGDGYTCRATSSLQSANGHAYSAAIDAE